jgi:hypothetical protein
MISDSWAAMGHANYAVVVFSPESALLRFQGPTPRQM